MYSKSKYFCSFLELSTNELWVEKNYASNFDVTWENVDDRLERIHASEVSLQIPI